ncbi:MAG: SRPBCC family protein [Pirellulaceae bacterium]
MARLSDLVIGASTGAALVYFFDPERGRRRRSLARNQLNHAISEAAQAADATFRDVRHRAYGSFAEMRSSLQEGEVPDEILVERVRSRMGRYVSHPSSIEVDVSDGNVALRGVILKREEEDLLSAVASVRGVKSVESQLEVHSQPGNVPELQGGRRRPGELSQLMQENWSPTTRLATGTAGCLLMANCLNRGTVASLLGGTVGLGLFMRTLTNLETKRLLGITPTRRGIDLQKTGIIYAPIEAVFSLLANPENYPRFTNTITSVRKLADDRYRKKMRGPMGVEVELDEIITRSIPHEMVACKSGPNSQLKYAGRAQFESVSNGGTRVHIRFTYNPPGGVFTHAVAQLLGFDPKALVDDVFMRAKSYLETGHRPHDAAEPTTPELQYRRSEDPAAT